MAWIRIARQSRAMRSNVDVWVTTRREEARWLLFTPDTYRIGRGPRDTLPPPSWTTWGEPQRAPQQAWEAQTPVVFARATRPAMPSSKSIAEPGFEALSVSLPVHYPEPEPEDISAIVRTLRSQGTQFQAVVMGDELKQPPVTTTPIPGDVVVIISAVPLHDVGGGSRGAQLAHALLAQGIFVAYVAAFPAQETSDLGLRYQHDNLEQWTLSEFDAQPFGNRVLRNMAVLVSVPSSQAVALTKDLQRAGATVIYDVIDDWDDPGLGGDWFDATAEAQLMSFADFITASATDLIVRTHNKSGHEATLIPNGVNETLFANTDRSEPTDWPGGAHVIGYHGSMYGSWMDWNAVRDVATNNTSSTVIMIGDPKGAPTDLGPNVSFLGLKPQAELAAYISRFDVGILPFLVNATTHAVSPLKVFEYLACGVPVAAPPLRALDGIDGVYSNDSLSAAVSLASNSPGPDRSEALMQHGWYGRVEQILSLLGWEAGADLPVLIKTNRAIHYPRNERRIRPDT